MDLVDQKILGFLQRDISASVGEIAESVGLSATPCWRRIKKLEDAGIIKSRVALLDPTKININLTAFVMVKTAQHNQTWLTQFSQRVATVPEVIELHRMSGEIDYLLKVVCKDMASFDEVYKRLISLAEFSDVSSTFSMEILKHTTELPLTYCE